MPITKVELAKTAIKFVVGASVGSVVKSAIKTHVPTENQLEEIQLLIATYVIGSMAADYAVNWADNKLESAIQTFRTFREQDNAEV